MQIDYKNLPLFAKKFSEQLVSGDKILLFGDMGAGKTTFTREVCHSMGIHSVHSPTFSLIHTYSSSSFFVYHLDLYRLETVAETQFLDLETLFLKDNSVFFVEWPERLPEHLRDESLSVTISYEAEESRLFRFESEVSTIRERFSHIRVV